MITKFWQPYSMNSSIAYLLLFCKQNDNWHWLFSSESRLQARTKNVYTDLYSSVNLRCCAFQRHFYVNNKSNYRRADRQFFMLFVCYWSKLFTYREIFNWMASAGQPHQAWITVHFIAVFFSFFLRLIRFRAIDLGTGSRHGEQTRYTTNIIAVYFARFHQHSNKRKKQKKNAFT